MPKQLPKWTELYEILEAIALKNGATFELVLTSQREYYVHLDIFGEVSKVIITKDFSCKEVALDSAITMAKELGYES